MRRGKSSAYAGKTSTTPELIRIRQQVQRVNGDLRIGPAKTKAGIRDLPLLGIALVPIDAPKQD